MRLSRSVQTFLSPDSSLGFGIADHVELVVAIALTLLCLLWTTSSAQRRRLRFDSPWWVLAVALFPVGLRLALLARCPVPIATGADDFSYILLADTLRHFRLANPPHSFPAFFQQIFVLQQPTHSSMYPLGQGIALALGWLVFGHPWVGVLLSIGALCGACYWMLRGWTSPAWALAGGVLATFAFGPLSYWTNSYWGGALSATAGCLVFGALPRLRGQFRVRDATLLGCGLGVQMLTRPFESCFLVASVALFFLPSIRRRFDWRSTGRIVVISCLPVLAATTLTLSHNRQVTGHWSTLPYELYRYQYGMPASFTFQPNPIPHSELNEEQDLAYRAQSVIHGTDPETFWTYFDRLLFRFRFLRFFWLPPLYVAAFVFLISTRRYDHAWILVTITVFLLGSNFYPYFFPHYVAALAGLFILVAVLGLERLNGFMLWGRSPRVPTGSLLLFLCGVHFLIWFGVHAVGSDALLRLTARFETWDYINYGDPQGRIAIGNQLAAEGGKKLVFVHYAPGHQFQEWVQNAADIDSSPVVWAHDRDSSENEKLRRYYPDRTAWIVEPDQSPPRLTRYLKPAAGFQDVR